MTALVTWLRSSEWAWTTALFGGLWLVLASGSPVGQRPPGLLAQAAAAALGTLLALWVARSSGQRRRGLAIALAAIFTTPLLPYAFVERALALPLLLFAAGFLAIGPTRLRSPARDLGLLLATAGILVLETSSLLLVPLLLWLAWCAAERRGTERRVDPKPGFFAAAGVLAALSAGRVLALDGGTIAFAASPVEWLVHVHGFLLSLNKGLVLFAPLVLIGLWRAFRGAVTDRRAGRFALFAAASLIVPFAGLESWSDASWGPRPLLAALTPALLALALSRAERARRGGHRRWILAAVVCGLVVNTLGTAIPQTALADVANLAGVPPTGMSLALQHDPAWNHPRVNAVLLGVWLVARLPILPAPEESVAPAVKRLAAAALPGPVLLRVGDAGERAALLPRALLLAFLGALGWAILVLVRHAAKLDPR
ncbi:MAG: hypothetical protein ABI689_03335 [Thermoanaerobaculia bacterium]